MNPKIFSHPKLIKELPDEVKILFGIFGDEIRLVGGSVRDLLLGKKVNDFDFATRFLPQETIKILEKNKIKAVPTGVKFGTITAVLNEKNFEITTLRKDSQTDGRHCNPEFVDDYFLDAARRDFTINALYLNSAGFVTDYFDGISDLKNHQVKFIGDANKRIEEDFLRILRFFRFSNEYAQKLDIEGLKACTKQRKNLEKLSRERIRSEILKILMSEKKENLIAILKILKSKKIAAEILSSNLDIKALENLFEIEKKLKISTDLNLKMVVLFFSKDLDLKIFGKEICATNAEKSFFEFVSLYRDGLRNKCKVKKSRTNNTFSRHLALVAWSIADLNKLLLSAKKETVMNFYLFIFAKNYDPEKIPEAKKIVNYLKNFFLPIFPLKSEDLIQLGFLGKNLGIALQKAKEIWAENDFKITKSELIASLKE